MPRMSDKELLDIVNSAFDSSMGVEGGDIATERASAWDFYHSKLLGNEVDWESKVVTSEVAEVVDGIMPSLMRIFTSAENLIEFEPVGEEDIEAAEQESDYVNYVFFKKNPAFMILYNWSFDGLVGKNGIVKAYWEESNAATREPYKGLNDDELALLLGDDELELLELEQRQEEFETELGPVQATVHDAVFQRTAKSGSARVENVPPEEYRISSDASALDPCKAEMVGHERSVKRYKLLELGYERDQIETLPALHEMNLSQEQRARKDRLDERKNITRDKWADDILVREGYQRVDYERNGKSELRRVVIAGNELLENEACDRQPFHVWSPCPMPHKHFGTCPAEKVMDLQAISSTLLRQVLNNLYHTNNPMSAIYEQAIGDHTLDDLMDRRIGGNVRFTRPVSEAFAPMAVPFTAASTFPMLEYFEKKVRDRTGVHSDSEGLTPEALKNIQTTVLAQAHDISRMKVEMIARIFAETGLKSLFLHIHELLLKHQNKGEMVQLRGKWVEVDPREWRTRLNMTPRIGLGIGTREQNLVHMTSIWDKQRDIVGAGGFGTIITAENVYNSAAEFVKIANFKNPERFFTLVDQLPQQEDDPKAELAQMQLQIAARQQELDAARLDLDTQKVLLQNQREIEKISLQAKESQQNLSIEMEKIANKLTELELNYKQNVPGARV